MCCSGLRLSFLEELDAIAESFFLSASALGRVSSLLLKGLWWSKPLLVDDWFADDPILMEEILYHLIFFGNFETL